MTTPTQPQTTNIGLPFDQLQQTATTTNLPIQYVSPPQTTGRFFTEDDVERIRQQEKDKMYSRLEKSEKQLEEFRTTVDSLAADKKARDEELARQQQAAADEAKRLEQEKLSVQQLLEQHRAETQAREEQRQAEWDLKLVTMQKEQELLILKAYIQRRINEEVNNATIIPDLAEYIDGATEEQVEASIKKAQEKTASIVQGAQSLTSPQTLMGTSPTGAPFSPLDRLSGPRQYTAQEIAAMPVSSPEYQAYRKQLGLDRAGSGRGLLN